MSHDTLKQTESPKPETSSQTILFFDGTCGLCNWTVDFILKWDSRKQFSFSPLQSETAKTYLDEAEIAAMETVVLFTGEKSFRKSSAIIRLLWKLNLFWKLNAIVLWLIPKPIRDWGYKTVAKNRYRWFGKRDACRVPTPEERARFLD